MEHGEGKGCGGHTMATFSCIIVNIQSASLPQAMAHLLLQLQDLSHIAPLGIVTFQLL